MESVPEMEGSIRVSERVEPDKGSSGSDCIDRGLCSKRVNRYAFGVRNVCDDHESRDGRWWPIV